MSYARTIRRSIAVITALTAIAFGAREIASGQSAAPSGKSAGANDFMPLDPPAREKAADLAQPAANAGDLPLDAKEAAQIAEGIDRADKNLDARLEKWAKVIADMPPVKLPAAEDLKAEKIRIEQGLEIFKLLRQQNAALSRDLPGNESAAMQLREALKAAIDVLNRVEDGPEASRQMELKAVIKAMYLERLKRSEATIREFRTDASKLAALDKVLERTEALLELMKGVAERGQQVEAIRDALRAHFAQIDKAYGLIKQWGDRLREIHEGESAPPAKPPEPGPSPAA